MHKKAFFTLSVLAVCFFCSAQGPVIAWQKYYGGSGNDEILSTIKTFDGGYAMCGLMESTDAGMQNNGSLDYWIVKLDNTGAMEWQKLYGDTSAQIALSIKQTSDSGFIVAGYLYELDSATSTPYGGNDVQLLKLDASGNLLWQKTLGGSGDEVPLSVIQTTDGGYALAAWSTSNNGNVTGNHGNQDYWVVKLDTAGNILWQNSFGGSAADEPFSIIQTDDEGYAVMGRSESTDGDITGGHGGRDYWLLKLNNTGQLEWQKSYGGTNTDEGMQVIQTAEGGFVLSGYAASNDGQVTGSHGMNDLWVVKTDSIGNIQWQKAMGGMFDEWMYNEGLITTLDGGYALFGNSSSSNGDVTNHGPSASRDYWLVKLNTIGSIEWQKSMGGNYDEDGYSVLQTLDGDYLVNGYSDGDSIQHPGFHGGSDSWLVKLDMDTCFAGFYLYPDPDTSMHHHWFAVNQAWGTPPVSYLWNWGDSNTSSGATPSHSYDTAGYYNICLSIIDADGCTASYCNGSTYIYKTESSIVMVNVVTENTTGVTELSIADAFFTLSPNPATNQLNITIDESLVGSILNIYNLTGALVQTAQLQTINNKQETDNLPTGMYIAEVKTKQASVKKRWVKM